MQNRNYGGSGLRLLHNNDTPHLGPKKMVQVQSVLLTIATDDVNWRCFEYVWQQESINIRKKVGRLLLADMLKKLYNEWSEQG